MQLRVPITLTPGRPRRAPPWALEAYSVPSPRPVPRAPPRALSGPAALLAPPPLPATARSRALGPVTGRRSGPWSGILWLFWFPASRGPGFNYSPYLNEYEAFHRADPYLVLLDRTDPCGQVDVQHAAARPERCAWSGCSRSSHPARMPWIGCGCHWRRSNDWRKTHAQRSCATGDEQPAAAVRALARSAASAGRSRGPTMPPRCARAPANE